MDKADASYPTYVDARNQLGKAFGYMAIPVGIMVEPGGAVAFVKVPFSVDEESDRQAVDTFARGGTPEIQKAGRLDGESAAVESFAQGVSDFAAGDPKAAVSQWRKALTADPGNYLIRKQIWAVENPDRFYPEIDWDWQAKVLARERELEDNGAGQN